MRVFTDGSCSGNGKKGAKAGYAVWFPDHPTWSRAEIMPPDQPQTNQRAELAAIHLAIQILNERGEYDQSLVIYSDSEYSISCMSKWITGWVAKGWKTAAGKDVLHQDLIRDTTHLLTKFKSHRFHHVRAHTGETDDLSVQNDIVDKMAQAVVEGKAMDTTPVPTEDILESCPLKVMGPAVRQSELSGWIRTHLEVLPPDIVEKHLLKAFTEYCKTRELHTSSSMIQKTKMWKVTRDLLVERVDTTNE